MTSSSPVRRISLIIDAVAASRGGMTLGEIASVVELPLSTVHRTLNILLDVGYLKIEPTAKAYEIGDRLKRVLLLDLCAGSLGEIARPNVVELAEYFTESAFVAQLTSSGVQLVDFYLPTKGSRTLVHPGFEFPMHATAAGKSIFAFQSEEAVKTEMAKGLARHMPNTITSRKMIRAELAKIRDQGYAVNDVELDPGVYAVAAPVSMGNGLVIGALAVVGIRNRLLKHHKEDEISRRVMEAAKEVSRLMANTTTPVK
ncbi:MAG: IclR family transcriptional regulator [Pseudomonadota bacterium]